MEFMYRNKRFSAWKKNGESLKIASLIGEFVPQPTNEQYAREVWCLLDIPTRNDKIAMAVVDALQEAYDKGVTRTKMGLEGDLGI